MSSQFSHTPLHLSHSSYTVPLRRGWDSPIVHVLRVKIDLRIGLAFCLGFLLSTAFPVALLRPLALATCTLEDMGSCFFCFAAEAFAEVLVSVVLVASGFFLFDHGWGRSSSSKAITMLLVASCDKYRCHQRHHTRLNELWCIPKTICNWNCNSLQWCWHLPLKCPPNIKSSWSIPELAWPSQCGDNENNNFCLITSYCPTRSLV